MTDLQTILQAFPAGSKLLVIAAELPDGSERVHVVPSSMPLSSVLGTALTSIDPESFPHVLGAVNVRGGTDDHSPVARVQRVRRTRGNVALKPREWAAITGLSARELRRAIDASALPHEDKEDGRDHGAKLITAEAILGYLATVYAVEGGQMDAPAWWTSVRGKRPAA